MSTRPRRSLRDFDDEAIAAPDPTPAPAATPEEAVVPASPPPARATRPRTAKSSRDSAGGPADEVLTTRMGIYLHPHVFDAAKSAYLVDLDALPEAPDSFARWISAAIGSYAEQSAAARTAAIEVLPPEERVGSGVTRSFDIPNDIIAAMNTAIITDRESGRYLSRSEFAGQAIRTATEHARTRAGGVLPPPPARLPNKPVR